LPGDINKNEASTQKKKTVPRLCRKRHAEWMARLLIICTTNAFKTAHTRNLATANLLRRLSNTFWYSEGELFCHYGDLSTGSTVESGLNSRRMQLLVACPPRPHWLCPSQPATVPNAYRRLFPWGLCERGFKSTMNLHLVPKVKRDYYGARPPFHAIRTWSLSIRTIPLCYPKGC
jgi:hypothetical protein